MSRMSRGESSLEEVSLLEEEYPNQRCCRTNNQERKPWRRVIYILGMILGVNAVFSLGRMSQIIFPSIDEQISPSSSSSTSPRNRTIKNPRLTPLGPACAHDDWTQAKSQGCVYDLMLSSWLHPACTTVELYAQYREWMAWRNVTFWREPEMINEVSYEEAESGEHGFLWAQGIQHHLHCSYVWDRQRYAEMRTPKVLDTYSRNASHVDHCVFFNAVPFGWEIEAPNVTKIYQPYDNECLVDSS